MSRNPSTHLPSQKTQTRLREHTETSTAEDTSEPIEPLYTPEQAAQLLTVKESWLRKKAAARAIPCTFLGKHLRFSAADIRMIVTTSAQPVRTPTGRPRRR